MNCDRVKTGKNVFIDDKVLIHQEPNAGPVELSDRVKIHEDTQILVGLGGSVLIGADTSIHRGCQIESYQASIKIGCRVEIAPRCAFQSFDHGMAPGLPISKQPLTTKGPIFIDDDAWLGYGVVVLSGVCIGEGAVIGAGSVVTRDVPPGAIAVGVPARVVRMRTDRCQKKQPIKALQ
jgi:acetyltransferase-like isoleucine patch superfamily enzyme